MNSTQRDISSVESPETQSRGKRANQQVHREDEMVHSSSDGQELHDPTCPASDQTTIVDRDSTDDSGKNKLVTLMLVYSLHVGVVVETRSKHANDASAVAAVIDAEFMGGLPCEKEKDDPIVDNAEEDQSMKPEQQVSEHRKANSEKANKDGPANDDDRNFRINPLEGFGQKKHVLEWLHMTYSSAPLEKAQVEAIKTLKEESIRARLNAERKLEREKALLADKQIRLAELENERLAIMTPDERKTQTQTDQLRKELELLEIFCTNKDTEKLKLQQEVLDVKTELEKEKANRMVIESRLIRAGLNLNEEAIMTGS
ncbi:hypothetical protein RSOLAG22IIIB_09328 [Rhizoctonia solani]|uniref:Uncharacterized protein n=1 Tax=Rhizoctonia solani TaxID=456999 RepID=A0A0K6FXW7_9AGAM|nr:hypothetical protein RSOLAG22IIIB_09328 [Rhizoctonia solani]